MKARPQSGRMGRMPRLLLRLFFGSLLTLTVSAPILLLLLALQGRPAVAGDPPLSVAEIRRLEQMLIDNAPSSPEPIGNSPERNNSPEPINNSLHRLILNQEQFNLLLRYGIEVMDLDPEWAARVAFAGGGLDARLSVLAARQPWPLYLNVQGRFSAEEGRLGLRRLQLGRLQLPQPLLRHAVAALQRRLARDNAAYYDIEALVSQVHAVHISGSAPATATLNVSLYWDDELIDRLSDATQKLFFSAEDRARILVYYQRIGEVAATVPSHLRAISLTALISPLFSRAAEYSAAGADPIAENRALFQALTVYINNEDIASLVGPELAAGQPRPPFVEVRLQRRHDLARHLVAIAAITGSAGADIASLLSTTKEAYDARHRSGFSFSDLTANTVGVSLASLATRDRQSALEMQRRLARVSSEDEYMPDTAGADHLSESEFNAQFENRESTEYQRRLAEIHALIRALPVFRGIELEQ